MTIAYSTDPGGLFVILGGIACAIRNTNGRRGAVAPSPASAWGASGPAIRDLETEIDNIIGNYSAAQQVYYDGIRTTQGSYASAHDTYISSMVALARKAIVESIQADNPQPDTSDATILAELIRQMEGSSQTVLRCTVGSTVTAGGSNIGNPTVLCSTTGRFGDPLEYVYAETMVAKVTSDDNGNGSGTATSGQEPIGITGGVALTNKFSADWPDGSGASASINIVDPELDDSGGNLLTNSNFETYTVANTPDNWATLVGTNGTSILKSTTNTYASTSACLQFVGDGSELTSIAQTLTNLLPGRVYGVRFYTRVSATPSTGVLKIDLIDGSNAVVADDAGTDNTLTLALTGISTTYTAVSGFFRTPTNMPDSIKIRVRLSTALDNAKTCNIDYGAMALATQLYTAGPYIAAFRGSTDVVFGDRWTLAITNDRAGLFQTFFEQAFSMSTLGLYLPSLASSNTIDDSLIS